MQCDKGQTRKVCVFFSWLDQNKKKKKRALASARPQQPAALERCKHGKAGGRNGRPCREDPTCGLFFDPVTRQPLFSLCPKSACVTNLHPGEHESAAYDAPHPRRVYSHTSRICLTSNGYILKVVALAALGGPYLTDG